VLRKLTFASVAAVGLMAGTAMPAMAQPSVGIRLDLGFGRPAFRPIYPVPVTVARPIERHYHVMWRSLSEQERSFDCADDARAFARRMERQGYDARVSRHRSHYHVRYVNSHWETYRTVYSHREAHDLVDYLRSRGHEARVEHR